VQLALDAPEVSQQDPVTDGTTTAGAAQHEQSPDQPNPPLQSTREQESAQPLEFSFDLIRQRSGWTIWNSTNLLGKANIILSWYWDGDSDGEEEDCRSLKDGMKVVRALLAGKSTSKFRSHEWFCLYDALARYPEPDEELERLRIEVEQKYEEAVRREGNLDS
jgi:hypothetical protein